MGGCERRQRRSLFPRLFLLLFLFSLSLSVSFIGFQFRWGNYEKWVLLYRWSLKVAHQLCRVRRGNCVTWRRGESAHTSLVERYFTFRKSYMLSSRCRNTGKKTWHPTSNKMVYREMVSCIDCIIATEKRYQVIRKNTLSRGWNAACVVLIAIARQEGNGWFW